MNDTIENILMVWVCGAVLFITPMFVLLPFLMWKLWKDLWDD